MQRVALITGAAGGIGSAVAEQLGLDGFALALTDRIGAVQEVVKQMAAGSRAAAWCADLQQEEAVARLVQDVLDRFGRCDVLVNVAGTNASKPGGGTYAIHETTLEQWSKTFAVNLTAPFLLSKAVIGPMRRQGFGRIVNVISRTGRTFVADVGADYVATKAGLQGFTRTLAGENANFGITANCVAPGRIGTNLSNAMGDDIVRRSLASIPMGRSGTTSEVAAAISFLVSDGASYVTGAVLDVNGGGFMP